MLFSSGYIIQKLMMVPIVLLALTFHECAHGWVSSKLGDPTPKLSGRLTLNPLSHLDPVGALLMVFTRFGWAKPVPIDPRYYKNPKTGMAVTAAAGPLSNLLLAVISMLLWSVTVIIGFKSGSYVSMQFAYNSVMDFFMLFANVNLCLMVFNLIPIPPLDGSRILGLFLSHEAYFKLQQYERYSFILIIILSLTGVFGGIIGTGVNAIMQLLFKMSMAIVGLVL